MKKVYLDYAATTPTDPEVIAAMEPYFFDKFGNASSLHAYGQEAKKALELLNQEGLFGSLINARFVAPLDIELIKKVCGQTKFIFTIEEGIREAGFGSAIAQELDRQVVRIGLPFEFIPHGSREVLLEKYGLTATGIAKNIRLACKK